MEYLPLEFYNQSLKGQSKFIKEFEQKLPNLKSDSYYVNKYDSIGRLYEETYCPSLLSSKSNYHLNLYYDKNSHFPNRIQRIMQFDRNNLDSNYHMMDSSNLKNVETVVIDYIYDSVISSVDIYLDSIKLYQVDISRMN